MATCHDQLPSACPQPLHLPAPTELYAALQAATVVNLSYQHPLQTNMVQPALIGYTDNGTGGNKHSDTYSCFPFMVSRLESLYALILARRGNLTWLGSRAAKLFRHAFSWLWARRASAYSVAVTWPEQRRSTASSAVKLISSCCC